VELLGDVTAGTSKKEAEIRRSEILDVLIPPLCRLVHSHGPVLARSVHGCGVVYEALGAAMQSRRDLAIEACAALASSATKEGEVEGDGDAVSVKKRGRGGGVSASSPLIIHSYGAPLLKRLIQSHAPFASALLDVIRGELTHWACAGGGWVILALLESTATHTEVIAEIGPAANEIASAAAAGCRSLGAAIERAAPRIAMPKAAAPRVGKLTAHGKTAKRARGGK